MSDLLDKISDLVSELQALGNRIDEMCKRKLEIELQLSLVSEALAKAVNGQKRPYTRRKPVLVDAPVPEEFDGLPPAAE